MPIVDITLVIVDVSELVTAVTWLDRVSCTSASFTVEGAWEVSHLGQIQATHQRAEVNSEKTNCNVS
jgi:hypothetical protein